MPARFSIVSAQEASWAAAKASGCSNVIDFLTSQLVALEAIIIFSGQSKEAAGVEASWFDGVKWGEDGLCINRTDYRIIFGNSDNSWRKLFEALASIPTLRILYVASIPTLRFINDLLIFLIPQLTHLALPCIHQYGWSLLGIQEALLNTTMLECLSVPAEYDNFDFGLLAILTSQTTCSSLKSLSLHFNQLNPACEQLLRTIITGLTQNTISLCHVSLFVDSIMYGEDWPSLGTMLLNNTSLTSLRFKYAIFPEKVIHSLFSSLKKNLNLNSLYLTDCRGENWSPSIILHSLQANATIHEVDLTGTPLEGNGAIAAQLARNKEHARRVNVMSQGNQELVRPSTVRVFLCGLPFSGKTTLSRSLAKWSKRAGLFTSLASRFSRGTNNKKLNRTRGIDVTILEKEQLRMSLWDMAGQSEYHSFHDNMFPDLSGRATPSIFLYVWNPFEVDDSGNVRFGAHGRRTRKDLDTFKDEFRYWLKFIASKTLKSNNYKPKLFVAVTRADFGYRDMQLWLAPAFTALQQEFQEFIHFDMGGLVEMDARDSNKVVTFASHIFQCARIILEEASAVYKVCDNARSVFHGLVHANQIPPLVTKERFHFLCQQFLGVDSEEMRNVVALSLNDSGDIIFFDSLELVVIDTQWFCREIMGDLLHDSIINESDDMGIRQGFFPTKYLEALLESKVNSRISAKLKKTISRGDASAGMLEPVKVEGDALLKLLMGLQLACPKDLGEEFLYIFVPASLSGRVKSEVSPIKYLKSDEKYGATYLGRRLTCKDTQCTFFTPGIFPSIQVTFHKILTDRNVNIELEQDVIAFAYDGVEVFMEFCALQGRDYFIDILVCSCHTVDETIEWVQKNVTSDVEKVCADPRGIQGVEIMHSVIRPACVAEFVVASRRQAVYVEGLQDKLRDHVQIGVNLANDGIRRVMHTWQSVSPTHDYVVTLIGEAHTFNIVKTYQCGLIELARDLSDIVAEDRSASCSQQRPVFRNTSSGKEREAIFNAIRELREEQREGFEKLARSIEDLRSVVLPKLRDLMTFVKEGEGGRLPRMFVVTKDDGMICRVVRTLVPGLKNVQLQLLCECDREPHLVDGKHGLSLAALDDGLLKRGLPYINAFLKVAHGVVKVGAHIAVGFGDIIPDFTRLLANVVDTPQYDQFVDFLTPTVDCNSSSRVDFQNGQQWLFDFLSSRHCIDGVQIYATFGLRRVRYNNNRVAWVCDKHYLEGQPRHA